MLGSLLLYLAVSLMDPGYVNVQPQPQVTGVGECVPEPSPSHQQDTQDCCDGLMAGSVQSAFLGAPQ